MTYSPAPVLIGCALLAAVIFAHVTILAAPLTPLPFHMPGALREVHIQAVRPVSVRQDPFISPVSDEAASAADATPAPNMLPPDTPAAASSAPPVISLHAVVVGDHSYALVSDAASQRVVTIGDKLGGSTVKAISMQGLDLADGTHFTASAGGR